MLALVAGLVWKDLLPHRDLGRPGMLTRSLPGHLDLVLPEGGVLENAGYELAGRLVTHEVARSVRVKASWSEAPAKVSEPELATIQAAWLGALSATQQVPSMSATAPTTCAKHPAVRSRGVSSERHEYRAVSWVCGPTQRVIHVLVSAPLGIDLDFVESSLARDSVCHRGTTAAAPGPRARLRTVTGWNEVSTTGTRRSYVATGGVLDAVLEEGPRPEGSPIEHVMKSSELWAPLLTGVIGRPMPVEGAGAAQVRDLLHGHPAVRVHGRLQPPPTASNPLAPILFVETTIWACATSDRIVSVSAVSPDRKALERARAVLDSAVCH